jgi:Short C-terminal domain
LNTTEVKDNVPKGHLSSGEIITPSTPPDSTAVQPSHIENPANNPEISNPLHILKIRFAKGEINKEEYEEMRKMLEST